MSGHAPVRRREAGFTLVELMIALVVTLIISGSIVALLNMGQTDSRRLPALVDRQQNIRAALLIIERDVLAAGQQMPNSVQAFSSGLNAVGPMGPNNERTDFLQIVGNTGSCPDLDVCSPGKVPHNTGVSITTSQPFPPCMSLPGMVMLYNTTEWAIKVACPPGNAGNQRCAGGNDNVNGHANIPPKAALREWNSPGGLDFVPTGMSSVEVNRYEIRIDAQGIPNLWRSPRGGMADAACGGGNNATTIGADWQLVARGIEDMQIQYLVGLGAAAEWVDSPPTVVAGEGDSLVRRVRVTLASRTIGEANLHGETQPATGPRAVRGELTTTVTPRAVLTVLNDMQGGTPLWK